MQVSDGEFDVLGLETGCRVNGEFWDGQDDEYGLVGWCLEEGYRKFLQ